MNPVMKQLCPSATHMIRIDHAHVKSLYEKLGPQVGLARREAITRQICAALEIHAQVEEQIFYPALHQAGVETELLDKSLPEHEGLRKAIARVRELPASDPHHVRALAELMQQVLHHVADEEARLLPAAERHMNKRLNELGLRMTELKMQLAKPHLGQLTLDLARASPLKAVLLLAATATACTWLAASLRTSAHSRTHG